jgi:hypothetical protein
MTKIDFITILAAVFSAISAGFWGWSATVSISKGFDNDEQFAKDMKKASAASSLGALFSALAALCAVLVTASKYIPILSFLN